MTSLAALLCDGRPLLIHTAQAADQAGLVAPWSDRLSVVEVVPESASVMLAPAVVIRPDGYVLWSAQGRGAGAPGLAEVATAWLGAPAQVL
ncbi:hypothetical protein [Streptomyces sp. NPDC051576]|uniref:aromatic-ring hydroxylase C-terminal domain-containing protein n=1 Tax=Streptomyces sp. NPDC051576 TaxID=3155803 RepID=UPI003442E14D